MAAGDADVVALTRLVRGSTDLDADTADSAGRSALSPGLESSLESAGRYSIGFGSSGEESAAGGRGRGIGLDGAAEDGAGSAIAAPNIGAG